MYDKFTRKTISNYTRKATLEETGIPIRNLTNEDYRKLFNPLWKQYKNLLILSLLIGSIIFFTVLLASPHKELKYATGFIIYSAIATIDNYFTFIKLRCPRCGAKLMHKWTFFPNFCAWDFWETGKCHKCGISLK